jgi:hypothetical protein
LTQGVSGLIPPCGPPFFEHLGEEELRAVLHALALDRYEELPVAFLIEVGDEVEAVALFPSRSENNNAVESIFIRSFSLS